MYLWEGHLSFYERTICPSTKKPFSLLWNNLNLPLEDVCKTSWLSMRRLPGILWLYLGPSVGMYLALLGRISGMKPSGLLGEDYLTFYENSFGPLFDIWLSMKKRTGLLWEDLSASYDEVFYKNTFWLFMRIPPGFYEKPSVSRRLFNHI